MSTTVIVNNNNNSESNTAECPISTLARSWARGCDKSRHVCPTIIITIVAVRTSTATSTVLVNYSWHPIVATNRCHWQFHKQNEHTSGSGSLVDNVMSTMGCRNTEPPLHGLCLACLGARIDSTCDK